MHTTRPSLRQASLREMARRKKNVAKKQLQGKASLEEGLASLQGQYDGRLMPPLDGLAYRFTIWLPIQSRGMPVFTKQHCAYLVDFLLACCGGCSQSNLEGFPPWSG